MELGWGPMSLDLSPVPFHTDYSELSFILFFRTCEWMFLWHTGVGALMENFWGWYDHCICHIYIYISQIHIYIYTWIFARNSSVDLYFCVLLCEFLFFFHWICWMGRGLAGSVGVCCSGKTDFNIQKKTPLVYMEIKRFLIIVIAEFLQGKVCFCWRKRY